MGKISKIVYPEDSTFGARIKEMAKEKQRVAKRIVDDFLLDGAAAFISDGSSTFYVGLEVFRLAKEYKDNKQVLPIKIDTNNLAIAHEYALWNTPHGEIPGIEVYSIGGDVKSDLMMVFGRHAATHAAKSAQEGPFLILAVRAITGKHGPAGLELLGDVQIKKATLKAGEGAVSGVIFVADHKKLSQPYKNGLPLLYPNSTDWDGLMKNTNTYVISTKHPEYDPLTMACSNWANPQTEKDCYLANQKILKDNMGARFVEV